MVWEEETLTVHPMITRTTPTLKILLAYYIHMAVLKHMLLLYSLDSLDIESRGYII